jgi:hypothetical protein
LRARSPNAAHGLLRVRIAEDWSRNVKHALAIAALALAAGCAGQGAPFAMGPAPTQARTAQSVDPASMEALRRMGSYLMTLQTFEVTANANIDEVLDTGQKVQFAQTTTYKVRRPNAFHIATVSDRKVRDFIYDGRQLTVWAPRTKFYAQVDAPPTIREVLDLASERYDVNLPLEDLFHWGTPEARFDDITSATRIGFARIGGVETDQYAFRQGEVDWQVWIERGSRALPRKLVITTRDEQAQPQYSATLDWNLSPRFGTDTFAFRPPADAKRIPIVANTTG